MWPFTQALMLRCVFSLSVMPMLASPSVCNLPIKKVAVAQEVVRKALVTSSKCKTAVCDLCGNASLQGLERHPTGDVD